LADERARIARDLHDSLAQVFSALGLHLDNLARRLGREGQPAPEIGHLRQMLRYGRRASRAVVWNLRARGGAPDSLARALGELGSLYEGTPIEVVVEGTPYALGAEAEHELLSVAQEAVSNAVEHGQAAHVRIELEYARERFALWVRDDGRGTDASPGQGIPGHHGLVGMRERAARARGTLSFESSPDVGTEIGVVIDNPRSSGAPPA
jgi:signal transduction histidine kinase